MKTTPLIFLCLLMVSCSILVNPGSWVELPGDQPEGGERVFPYEQGRSCPSGDYDHFTIRQLTDFGERPVWRPDGRAVAFVNHEFGDAYEYDFDTTETRCLTCDFKHPGFLRVHYLKDGDFLLLGPRERGNDLADRMLKTGFFWMPEDCGAAPRWIGEEHFEGVAVSRESRKISYTKTWLDSPGRLWSTLYVAEVTMDGRIVNRKAVFHSPNIIEAQDFLPGDSGVTMARYTPTYEAVGYIFASGKYINYSKSPASEEPEGLFPDGKFTMIESDRHAMKPGDMDLELYMLRLDGTGRDVRRLTHFTDTPGEKASNPAVSPEGCRIAFMKAQKSQDPERLTGRGDGIFQIEFYSVQPGQ